MKQTYLLNAQWLRDELESADGLDPQERKKINLLARNFIEAMSPSNFPATNPRGHPDHDRRGRREPGTRGLENLVREPRPRAHGNLLIQQTDMSAFEVGKNMAVSPGKVVFENRLFQLLQYTPSTDAVHETPLLICPPWINKFYILDLNEQKSLIPLAGGTGPHRVRDVLGQPERRSPRRDLGNLHAGRHSDRPSTRC